MFKLIGAVLLLMLAVAAIAAAAGVLIVVGILWAGVKAGRIGWRWWEARPAHQVKRARARVLKPGEIDVRGF